MKCLNFFFFTPYMSGVECSPFTLFTLVWNFFNKFQYNSYHFTYETCRIHSFQFSHTLDSFAARRVIKWNENSAKVRRRSASIRTRLTRTFPSAIPTLPSHLFHSTLNGVSTRFNSIFFHLSAYNKKCNDFTEHETQATWHDEQWKLNK